MNCSNSRAREQARGSGEGLAGWDGRPLNAHVLVLGAWQQIQGVPTRTGEKCGIGVAGKTIQGSVEEKAQQQAAFVSKGKTPPVSHKFLGEKQTYRLSAFSCKGSSLLPPFPLHLSLAPFPLRKCVVYHFPVLNWTLCKRWKFATTASSACRWFTFDVTPLAPSPPPLFLLKFVLKTLGHLQ